MANVLLVVGSSATPSASDVALRDLLQTVHTVTLADDNDAEVSSASYDVGVIGNIATTPLGTKYRTWSKPLVFMSNLGAAATALSFLNGGGSTGQGTQDTIIIDNAAHALANGLSAGSQTVGSSVTMRGWSSDGWGSGAQLVALRVSGQFVLGGYETGAAMSDQNAPARRVLLGWVTIDNVNATGQSLILNAVTWAIGAGAAALLRHPGLSGGMQQLVGGMRG